MGGEGEPEGEGSLKEKGAVGGEGEPGMEKGA